MSIKIELFKEVNGGEQDFSHIGWEGKGHHAFWTMAEGYYMAAEILYDKMTESKGNYAIWDSVFYPMSFCYRHYVELTIKYLYRKYSECNEEQFKTFLDKDHNLDSLWTETKTFLEKRLRYLGINDNMQDIYSVIHQWSKYDGRSMQNRYPVDKENKQQNIEKRYDVSNLHSVMHIFHERILGLDSMFEDQIIVKGILLEEIEDFRNHLFNRLDDIKNLLDNIKPNEPEDPIGYTIDFSEDAIDDVNEERIGNVRIKKLTLEELFKKYNARDTKEDDKHRLIAELDIELKILVECLYYAGTSNITFPASKKKAIADIISFCAIQKKRDKFDWSLGGDYFGITTKATKAIYQNLYKVLHGSQLL